MVSVVAAPVVVGVTGLAGLKLVALHAGSGVPVPVTVQLSATGELYALYALRDTVEVPDDPGATAAGVVAVMLKTGPCAYFTAKASVPAEGPPKVPPPA